MAKSELNMQKSSIHAVKRMGKYIFCTVLACSLLLRNRVEIAKLPCIKGNWIKDEEGALYLKCMRQQACKGQWIESTTKLQYISERRIE